MASEWWEQSWHPSVRIFKGVSKDQHLGALPAVSWPKCPLVKPPPGFVPCIPPSAVPEANNGDEGHGIMTCPAIVINLLGRFRAEVTRQAGKPSHHRDPGSHDVEVLGRQYLQGYSEFVTSAGKGSPKAYPDQKWSTTGLTAVHRKPSVCVPKGGPRSPSRENCRTAPRLSCVTQESRPQESRPSVAQESRNRIPRCLAW